MFYCRFYFWISDGGRAHEGNGAQAQQLVLPCVALAPRAAPGGQDKGVEAAEAKASCSLGGGRFDKENMAFDRSSEQEDDEKTTR